MFILYTLLIFPGLEIHAALVFPGALRTVFATEGIAFAHIHTLFAELGTALLILFLQASINNPRQYTFAKFFVALQFFNQFQSGGTHD
jgi:hypothetical protein